MIAAPRQSITARPIIDAGEVIASLGSRVLGRTAAEDVKDPVSGAGASCRRTTRSSRAMSRRSRRRRFQSIRIRSVLTCETKFGVCAKCYGRDLARGTPVNMGEAVGVIAAQSIGEPGTQLTMRTFHIGGTAQVLDQSFVESNHEGKIRMRNRNVVQDSSGKLIVMGRNMSLCGRGCQGQRARGAQGRLRHPPVRRRRRQGEARQQLAEWDPYTRPIMTEVDGIVEFEDVVEGVSVNESRPTKRPASPTG